MRMDLESVQALQQDYDERHWEHASGFETIRHSTLHLGKLLGKISAYCEAAEHGEKPNELILGGEVIPDLLIFAARLANDRGHGLTELFIRRTEQLEDRFSSGR